MFVLYSCKLLSAGDKQYEAVGNFIGGLNTYYSSLYIDNSEVQDALNVYFDKDYAVTKRSGFTVYGSSASVQYYNSVAYTDSSSNNWLIMISTNGIFASKTGSFTIKIATVPAFNQSLVGATNAFGKVYFVDQLQGVYSWDGTSTAYLGSTTPKGSIITEFHNRLWVAGLAVPSQNQLWASEFLNGSNWTTGLLATDPVMLTIGLNDNLDGITGLYSGSNDTLYVFKQLSVNGVFGFDQTDFQVRILTRDAGCIDGGSIQPFRGFLVFASLRGVELFDGSTVTLISKKIKNIFDAATFTTFAQRVWTLSTSADWLSGVYISSGYRDTTDGLRFKFPDDFSSFRDSTTLINVWTKYESGTVTGSVSASGGFLNLVHNGGTLGRENIRTTDIMTDFKQGTTYHFTINNIPVDSGHLSDLYFTLRPDVVTSGNPDTTGAAIIDFESTTTSRMHIANFTMGSVSSSTVQDFALPATVDLYITTTTYQLTINSSSVAFRGAHNSTTGGQYAYLGYLKGSATVGTCTIDDFQIAPMQMNFTAPSYNVGTSITSWGSFLVGQDVTTGSIAYSVCSANNSAMTGAVCVSQTPNAQITVATNTYVNWSATHTTTGLTNQPVLDSGQVQWNEGARRPRMSSAYFEDRYLLSVATNTLSTGNDCTFVLANGLNNQLVWSKFDIHSGTWLLYRNSLYHGDSSATGNVYLDNQGYTDNGVAINAYVVTKDYALGNLIAEKLYNGLYLQAEGLGNYNIDTTYFLDKALTEFTLSDTTQNEQGNFLNIFIPFPIDSSHQVFSKLIRFKFSNNENNARLQLYGGILAYKTRPVISK